jgi:Ca-activated chloride channel family protein
MKTRISLALLIALSLALSVIGPVFADGIIIPNPPICKGGNCPPPCPPPPPCNDCRVPALPQPCVPCPLPPPPCQDCPVPYYSYRCPPFNTPLRVKYHHVDVTIDQQVATTHIDQVFVNEGSYSVEGTYVFPLPIDATVSNFSMIVDGKKVDAKILSADEARSIYNDIVRQQRDPALLEYVGRGAIQASVFPIDPGAERKIEIEYSQVLPANGGLIHYSYPLNTEKFSAHPLDSVVIRVKIKSNDALKAIYSPSHDVSITRDGDFAASVSYEANNVLPDKDFELFYSVSQQDIGLNLLTYKDSQSDQGFFLLLAAPNFQVDSTRAVPKDVIVVIDKSGSMDGEKIVQARNAVRYVIGHLNSEDRFNVISFSDEIKTYANQLRGANNAGEAKTFVDQIAADGSTDINRALLEALKSADLERPTTIIFITDGLPTEGETDAARIVDNFKKATHKNIRLFTFGVGDDVNTLLLDQLAQDNRGVSAYVRPGQSLDEIVSAFYAKISTPVLADIAIQFGSNVTISDMYPQPLPDLFAGSQLVMVGRYTGSGPSSIGLSGSVNGQSQNFVYESNFTSAGGESFIPRLWATRKIGSLLNEIRLHGENKELVDQIVSLSVRYGIITPYTSFLIQENADVFSQAGRQALADEANKQFAAPAPSSGAAAVDSAQAQQLLRSADQAAPITNEAAQQIQIVGDKTFILKNNVWTDTQFDPTKMKSIKVGFASDDYFKLSQTRSDVAAALALGSRVIVVIDGQAYEVEEGATSTQPITLPPTIAPQPTSQPSINVAPTNVPATKTPAAPTQCLGVQIGLMVMMLAAVGIVRKKKLGR